MLTPEQIKKGIQKANTIYPKGLSFICPDGYKISVLADFDNVTSETKLEQMLIKKVQESEHAV